MQEWLFFTVMTTNMLSTAVIHSTSSLLAAVSQTGTQCTFFDASLKHLAFLISDHLALKIAPFKYHIRNCKRVD